MAQKAHERPDLSLLPPGSPDSVPLWLKPTGRQRARAHRGNTPQKTAAWETEWGKEGQKNGLGTGRATENNPQCYDDFLLQARKLRHGEGRSLTQLVSDRGRTLLASVACPE